MAMLAADAFHCHAIAAMLFSMLTDAALRR